MIRRLPPGSPIPPAPPRRYSFQGYVILRWRVSKGEYVEVLEHRVVAGAVVDAQAVHHINGDKSDNRPENLQALTHKDHAHTHGVFDRHEVAELYGDGMNTKQIARLLGTYPGNVSRMLADTGTPVRPPQRRRTDIDEASVIGRLRDGEPVDRIARSVGASRTPIELIRRKHGIPPRPVGRPWTR